MRELTPPNRYVEDPDDLMRWPLALAVASTDLAQPYWSAFDLRVFSFEDAKLSARDFIRRWKGIDGRDARRYSLELDALLNEFFDQNPDAFVPANEVVHQAFMHRNLPTELHIWMSGLCLDTTTGNLAIEDDPCAAALGDWCRTSRAKLPLIDQAFDLQPVTEWDRWLSSEDGFYGDDEFLVGVQLGRIMQWRVLQDLQSKMRARCRPEDLSRILTKVKSNIDPDDADWVRLEL